MTNVEAYDAVLQDLKRQRASIDAAIAALTALKPVVSLQAMVASLEVPPALRRKEAGPLTGKPIAEAAIEILREADGPLHVSDITDALERGGIELNSADKTNTVGSILNRRAREKHDVMRVGRGTWALVSPSMALGANPLLLENEQSEDDELMR